MSAPAPVRILLHEALIPPRSVLASIDADMALCTPLPDSRMTTLVGMAQESLRQLNLFSPVASYALIGLGQRASALAQAMALELLGRDIPVTCVAVVPDHALPAGMLHPVDSFAAFRLATACEAWMPPAPSMLPTQQYPEDESDLVHWIERTLTSIALPPSHSASVAIPLKAGGSLRAPVFCIPGAGASVVSLLDIAQAVHPQTAVIGLQPRGLDGLAAPCATVETAVASMLSLVRQAAPRGPIRLMGHSFGGWIAHALAVRLQAEGRALGSLDLLDTRAPSSTPIERDDFDVLLRWIALLELSAEKSLGIDAAALRILPATARMSLIHQRMTDVGLLPARSSPASIAGAMRMFAACLRTGYGPTGVYNGVLRVVHLQNPALDAEQNGCEAGEMQSGWKRYASGVQLLRAEGNHMSGIRGTYAGMLAKRLGLHT